MTVTKLKKRIRLKGFDYQGHFRYSLTFCTRNKSPHFDNHSIVLNVAGILQETARAHDFKIWSCCFMPDHVHVLAEGESQSADLKKFVSAFKQKSGYWFRQIQEKQATLRGCQNINGGQGFSLARKSNPKGLPYKTSCEDLWQINYYEHVLRSDEATEKVARYILDNPVRKGLAVNYREYPFSWCQVFDFVGQGFCLADLDVRHNGKANFATLKGCPTKDKKNNRGFTLVEIVITIVLISIIAGIAAMIILQGVGAYSAEQARSDVHYQAKLAVERMAREIRLIRSQTAADIPTMNPTNIMYTDINGNQMGFQLNVNTIQRTQDNGTTWQTLASGVTALNLSYYQQDGVTAAAATNLWYVVIDVTDAQGSESLEIRTRVHPRNF